MSKIRFGLLASVCALAAFLAVGCGEPTSGAGIDSAPEATPDGNVNAVEGKPDMGAEESGLATPVEKPPGM